MVLLDYWRGSPGVCYRTALLLLARSSLLFRRIFLLLVCSSLPGRRNLGLSVAYHRTGWWPVTKGAHDAARLDPGLALAAPEQGVHRRRGAHAGARTGRQRRDLHRRARRAAAAAAAAGARAADVGGARAPREGRRSGLLAAGLR